MGIHTMRSVRDCQHTARRRGDTRTTLSFAFRGTSPDLGLPACRPGDNEVLVFRACSSSRTVMAAPGN